MQLLKLRRQSAQSRELGGDLSTLSASTYRARTQLNPALARLDLRSFVPFIAAPKNDDIMVFSQQGSRGKTCNTAPT